VHVFHVAALELKWHIPVAEVVGVRLRLAGCTTAYGAAKMEPDGWVPVQVTFRPQPGVRYTLDVEVEDVRP